LGNFIFHYVEDDYITPPANLDDLGIREERILESIRVYLLAGENEDLSSIYYLEDEQFTSYDFSTENPQIYAHGIEIN